MSSAVAAIPGGDLFALPRRELQALAKAHGLKANAKSEELAAQLVQLRAAACVAHGVGGDMGAPDAHMDEAEALLASGPGGTQVAAPPDATGQDDAGGDGIAEVVRTLEPDFCALAAQAAAEESPVLGLAHGGFTRRRGGAAAVAESPFEFGALPARTTLTPLDALLSGGAVTTAGSGESWLARARASLGALTKQWTTQNSGASPRRDSLLRATFGATRGGAQAVPTAASLPPQAAAPAVAVATKPCAPAVARRSSMAAPPWRASMAPKGGIAKPVHRHSLAPVARVGAALASRLTVVTKPGVPPAATAARSVASVPVRKAEPLAQRGVLRPGQVAPVDPTTLPYKPKAGPLPGRENKPQPRARFDLKASLEKPLTWQPKMGALGAKPQQPTAKPKVLAPLPAAARPPPAPPGRAKTPSAQARRASIAARGKPLTADASAMKRRAQHAHNSLAARQAKVAAARARA